MGGVYYFGKAIEAVSIKLRIGKFEVGENWQCQDCANNEHALCADCKDSWVYELSQLEYSNEYERRLGIASGASAIIMGVMAFLGNASMSFWESGSLLESLASIHFTLPNPWKIYYNYTILLLFLLAALIFWSAQLIGIFLGIMNPMATRHWRHMTASVWGGFFVFFVAIMILAVYNPLGDLIFVFWPVMTGLVICGVSLCMDMREGEGGIRLEGGEKV